MAMHLIDRPYLDRDAASHRGLSTAASAALHAAALVALVLILRSSPVQDAATQVTRVLPEIPAWIAHEARGDGRDQGGEKSIAPPRRARAVGTDAISVVAAPPQQASTDATIEPPDEASTIPARPLGDSTQPLAGAINSTGTSLGPGEAGQGASPGRDTPGFGEGAVVGGPGVTVPVPILRASPKYTIEAMHARIQGVAIVECVVLPDGTVGDARIVRSLDRRFGLDEEALAAARRWRFRPGRLNDKPVAVMVTIELMFTVR